MATYDGNPKPVIVSPTPPDSPYTLTYNGVLDAPTNVGTYSVVAKASGDYTGTGSTTLTITPKSITFGFSNLDQTADGTPKSATVTPSDPAATYSVTYNGNTTAPSAPGTYTVVATANGNFSGSSSTTLVLRSPANVTAAISVSPTSASSPGSTTISWSSTNASSVSVSGPGMNTSTAGSGSQLVTGLSAGVYTYTITAQGNGGPVTRTATFSVNAAPTVSASIGANPTSTSAPGTSVITWLSADASSVAVSGPGLTTTTAMSGSQTVSGLPAGTHTYTIVAQGNGGPITRTASVVVTAPVVTASISATPSNPIAPGSSTISWASANATSVAVCGPGLTTSTAATGNQVVSGLATGTYTYTIVAQGSGGPVTRTVTLTVGTATGLVTAKISASPYYGVAPVTATLTWSTTNATSASVSGPGITTQTATAGTATVSNLQAGTYTYTLTAQGSGGPVTALANVEVTSAGSGRNTAMSAVPQSIGWQGGTVAFVGDCNISGPGYLNIWRRAPDYSLTFITSINIWMPAASGVQWATWNVPPTTNSSSTTVYYVEQQGTDSYGGFCATEIYQSPAPAPTPQTVTVAPASVAATPGATVSFTAAGGHTGYVWLSGSSAGGAAGQFVVPAAATGGETYTVSVYSPAAVAAGTNWARSNTAVATITVQKATPTITWSQPAPITYGTAIGPEQLDATASAPGTFSYSPTIGSLLPVGDHPLTVTFTPANPAAYDGASASVTLTVGPKPVTFAFANLSFSYDGRPKTATVAPSDPGATFVADLTKGPDAGSYLVTAQATGNYTGSGADHLVISPIAQTVAVSPDSVTVFASQPVTFTASGGANAYIWGGTAGASGSASSVTLALSNVGTYTLSVSNAGGGNFLPSNTATATIEVVSNRAVTAFTPVVSEYAVTDPTSPMNGHRYGRMWQDGGWVAYLGRSGVKFNVQAQAWPSVQSVEIQSRSPGGEWTSLAKQDSPTGQTKVDMTFSVMLGTTAPDHPLVPTSFQQGAPLIGQWQFRARISDAGGTWSEFSPEIPVQVILPMTTRTVSGQTVPPAGALGDWFSPSSVKTFSVPLWIP
ncbi:MAG TPA: MBG domain-containing protein [Opitutaceae bacterium]|nr:MBG domain-containing protein [Opitutaceae bacterium]